MTSFIIFISKNGEWNSEHSETFDAIFHFLKKIRPEKKSLELDNLTDIR
jgi:hypothetical protein